MTATVLPFARPGANGAREKASDTRTASEIDRRAFIREIREALDSPQGKAKLQRRLRRDEDAVLLAKRLGADLEGLKKRERGALSRTLERADIKPTERARYAMFTDEIASGKRIRALHRYRRLSDAIAEALGQG